MSNENPVMFATIDRRLLLEAGTVERWSEEYPDDFPASEGKGVALVSAVQAWAAEQFGESVSLDLPELPGGAGDESDPVSESVDPASESPDSVSGLEPELPAAAAPVPDPVSVEWVTIRVPVISGSGALLAARIQQSFSLRAGDLHIRKAYGDVLAGCRQAGIRLADGSHVANFSAVHRYLGEQVAAQMAAALNGDNANNAHNF